MNSAQARRLQTNRYARWDAQGEGSRGGHIIGHTSSGKPIYGKASHPGHKKFTAKDHVEAMTVHRNLGKEAGSVFMQHPDEEMRIQHGRKLRFHEKQRDAHFNKLASAPSE